MPNARHGSEGWYLEMIQGGTDQWDTEAVYEWDSGPDNQWGGVVNDWLADGILVATDSKYLEWMGVGNIGAGGTAVVSTLERTGIQLGDEETVNRLLEIYPKIKSADDVLIQVGAYMDYNDTPSYVLGSSTESQDYSAAVGYYRPTADQKLNVSATGRLHAVKITFTQATDNDFSLTGYDLNYQPVGRR